MEILINFLIFVKNNKTKEIMQEANLLELKAKEQEVNQLVEGADKRNQWD